MSTGLSFNNRLYPGEVVINDNNFLTHCPPQDIIIGGETKGRGRFPPQPDERQRVRNALAPFLKPFNLSIIPPKDWPDLCRGIEESKTSLSAQRLAAGLPSLDQNGTNYCWGNGPVSAIHILQVRNGGPFIPLSPASAIAHLVNFANVGGWGYKALEEIVLNGICPQKYYPANSRDRSYYNEKNKKIALRYRVTEWMEIDGSDLEQVMTALLMRMPIAVGLDWWSHEICYLDPLWLNGAAACRFWNSWGDGYGSLGMSTLTGKKMLPDDAVIPLALSPVWYEDANVNGYEAIAL